MPPDVAEFHREYLVRLPLPLAQLYSRAFNAKEARARHDNAFYLFESLIKLAAAPAIATYLTEVQHGGPRVAALDRLLAQLALPSLGQWVAMLRELARHFGQRPDAASHPLGHLWSQLEANHRDRPAILALYRRIKNGPDGASAGDQSCSLLDLLDALVQYRNGVFGHGASRFDTFYEQEMGPLLLPAASELLAEGVWDFLGPQGSRLVYLTELRTVAEGQVQISLMELVGRESERMAPQELLTEEAASLTPNCVAVIWPGRRVPLRLDPLLIFRGTELAEEVLFLNRDRNGRQAEYLSYTTGRTERDRSMGPALAKLLSQVTGREVSESELQKISEQSLAETPSIEALFGSGPPTINQVGDYEILAEIGRGGMGVVYLARQLSLGRLVALKMLPADLAADEVALARFRREMRALGRCEHPHIVKVLSNGTLPDGRLYYTMEYVPGADLEMTWRELAGPNRQGAASSLGSTTWSRAVLTASRKQREAAAKHAAEGSARHATENSRASSAAARTPSPSTGEGRGEGEAMQAGMPLTPSPSPAQGEGSKQTTDSAVTPSSPSLPTPANALPELPLPPLPELPSAEDDPGGYSRRVAQLIRDAALALQAVHEQGIFHRDVKPANLMLTPDGQRIVLMDFGLAKGQSVSLSASKAGGLLGTLRYAAPEQLAAASLRVGATADVRGLGVTLWELLTRERLFGEAEDERQLAAMVHDQDVPRLRSIDPTLDADLEAIVSRATERRVADRIQTAGQLAEYLQLYLDGIPLPIRPPSAAELLRRWVRDHKGLVGSAAVAAAAIILSITIAFLSITSAKNEAVQARNDAVRSKNRAESQLVLSYIERGAHELTHGDKRLGLAILGQAYRTAQNDPALRGSTCTLLGSWYGSGYRQIDSAGGVQAAAFSPDGTKILTGCGDNTARLWNSVTGQPIGEPLQHNSWISLVAWSPDGSKILTASDDQMTRLWDSHTCKPLGEPLRQAGHLHAAVFSPDGTKVLTGSGDNLGQLKGQGPRGDGGRLWDAVTGKPLGEPLPHAGRVVAVAFSSDGKKLVTGSDDKTARLWEAITGKPLGEPLRHEGQVWAVAFSPEGTKVLTGSADKTAQLWDSNTGKPLLEPLRHDGPVTAVAFSPDGTKVATGSYDMTARLWNTATGKPLGQLLRHDGRVTTLAFSPDGTKLLTGSEGKTARLWDASTGKPLGEPLRHDDVVLHVAFSSDGSKMLTESFDMPTRLWNVAAAKPLGEPLRHENGASAVALSPDGTKVLSCDDDKTARLWNAATGEPIGKPLRHSDQVLAVAFSLDGTKLLTGSADKTARIWDAITGQPLGDPLRHLDKVLAVAFSPDGTKVLTASAKSARLWNAGTGQQLAELSHDDEVETVAFSPDGTKILTGSLDCTARLWDAASGKPLGEPLKHDQPVGAAIFSPDGTKILTGSGNGFLRTGEARLWDAATYRPLGEPLRHAGLVRAVAFSPDGTRLLTGSDDHTARLWDAATCQPLGQPLQHEDEVVFVAFHPDGTKVFTGSGSITVRQWRAPIALPDDVAVVVPLVALVSGLYEESAGVLRPTTSEQREAYWNKLSENGSTRLKKWNEQDQRDVLLWHEIEATDEESHELWFAAAFHLGYLIAHDPTDPDLRHRRARAYAKQGLLDKAAADNTAADKLTPTKVAH